MYRLTAIGLCAHSAFNPVAADDGSCLGYSACGCSEAIVKEIIEELQARKMGRGNVAQLKAQEVLAQRVDHIHIKLDAILKHLNLEVPPSTALAVPVVESMQR